MLILWVCPHVGSHDIIGGRTVRVQTCGDPIHISATDTINFSKRDEDC